ncbi:MAG: hypothetical protein A2X64_05355 [Ignavibacteria bacterium GWF2_33_9]|nr:MAG: hypothetical protein A2X64_05355 [Ignavibacteria bacterium GWF2_33_9]
MHPRVESFIEKNEKWQRELILLVEILRSCNLEEDFKWKGPVYMMNGKNILGIQSFKEYCTIFFFKGVLITDSHKIMIAPGENTQAMRQLRFTSVEQIIQHEKHIKEYVLEAVKLEMEGKKVKFKKKDEIEIPAEFQKYLDKSSELITAFFQLTPGRRRMYCLYFADAKQTKTLISRIEKYIPKILAGYGIMDEQ